MPFTYRDKPKLSERLRGKSGEELLNELKSDWDNERRMFFDTPSWGSRHPSSAFPRGFPFDEERGRTNIRSYLDEFANRHPEFADQLRGPPWSEDFVNSSFGRKRRGSGSTGEEEEGRQQPGTSQAEPSKEQQQQQQQQQQPSQQQPQQELRQNLNQFGLRNTVPLAHAASTEEDRRHRSMSAPPDHRAGEKPKRFQTKCEINMQDPTQSQGTPHPPQQPGQNSSSAKNVRLIPIQVEGRDEPIVNTGVDTGMAFGPEAGQGPGPGFDARLPRDFGSYQKHSPRFSQDRAPTPPQPPQSPHDETDSVPPPPPPKDPIGKVLVIQRDVEDLSKQVDNFAGSSRADKQYIYLDEMLTRNLIKLDDIETEGKENVRQARKDTIRTIQRCISMLESKAPGGECRRGEGEPLPMEVDRTKENTPVAGSEGPQTMEVEPPQPPQPSQPSQPAPQV